MIIKWSNLFFKALHPDRKEKKGENSHRACVGTLSCDRSPPIYRHSIFLIKTVIIIFISTNIYRPYVCDPQGPYILLVNNFIYPKIPYSSIFIYYLYYHTLT